MNLDGSKWSLREWIAGILALILSALLWIFVYVLQLKMEPEGFPTFLAVAATFLFCELVLRRLIVTKAPRQKPNDRQK